MKKNARKTSNNQVKSAPEERTLWLARCLRRSLYEFVIDEGMKAFDFLLEAERTELCGPSYRKGKPDDPRRWGKTEGRLVMGGRRVVVRRPRVRKDGAEVALPSWQEFADEDPLEKRTLEQMMLGVSTRGYERSVEPLPEELGPHGASKSAASRRFVNITEDAVNTWLQRDLSKLDIVVIMIDGIVVGDHTIVVALGIDATSTKHVLGLWQGATENAVVCVALLNNLIERGLDPQLGYLFVIDGGKALRAAIRDIFGKRALVQRCQEHKRRNVLGHLPEHLHPSMSKSMRDAFRSSSKSAATKRIQQLAQGLKENHPDAAASLREGLDELFVLKDLSLPEWLERTLSTTNPIENLNGTIRRLTRNVKRWRDGSMVRRWVGASIIEAQPRFRRLRGHKGMPLLLAALGRKTERTTRIDQQRSAA
jgi:transposase-like protein